MKPHPGYDIVTNKGENKMKYSIVVDEFKAENLKAGDRVMVIEKQDINTGRTWYTVSKSHAETGYPGNVDNSIRKFHGWRGTTNNISTTACGVYEVKSVEALDKFCEQYKVKVGRKDFKKGEE